MTRDIPFVKSCPLCSQSFGSLQDYSNHINFTHYRDHMQRMVDEYNRKKKGKD
jgi:uncharacterized C2H2 Zn-finger protein